MLGLTEYPEALKLLVQTARRTIGFFPAHNPRALEYPWLLENLPKDLRGKSILDVGAGVNPLPLVLAERGAKVTTLDNHPTVRSIETRESWNEWGFLDYGLFKAEITSVHRPFEAWTSPESFDYIYSISVIEHVPARIRQNWIRKFVELLKPCGQLLLTLDLEPNTENLWNLAEGVLVDTEEHHGTLASIRQELESQGLKVPSSAVRRNMPDSRVDCGFLICRVP